MDLYSRQNLKDQHLLRMTSTGEVGNSANLLSSGTSYNWIINGLLYQEFEDNKGTTTILQLLIPKSMQNEILEKAHCESYC